MKRSLVVRALCLSLCLTVSGCSEAPVQAPATAEASTEPRARQPGERAGARPPKGKPRSRDRTARSSAREESAGEEGAGKSPHRAGQPSSEPSRISDPVDAEYSGDVPDHAEIRSAAVADLGRAVAFSTTFDAPLPDRMEDRYTVMTVETTVRKGRSEISIYAEGEADGWDVYVTDDDGTRSLSGFRIDGNRMTFEVPWAAIGVRRFRWTASMAWTRGTETDTHFAFDRAPNHESASYPG